MEPTLSHGQYLLVNKLNYKWHFPARGDIVVVKDPSQPGVDCIKRIIGLPGEYIRIVDGRVVIDDQPIQEPYLLQEEWSSAASMSVWLLEKDEYVVLGDNRNNNRDSRRFGPVSRQHLVGKAWARYWPPKAWGTLPRQAPSLLQ